ncbi:TPA: hypothetical protein N0F65_007824 [Lagenidium giganteum]|uniref:Eukaryotic translation initiation factor 3 subunit F n=1 Tax=Lagenidium giganteum TaxID=4803 RepID=A0AAV2Z3Q1_9STRA|nr:TPA: hypothetical protein N0F65_007824 [Lagenidium giganteum]
MAPQHLLLGTEAVCDVKVHPVVIFQILDRALRRSEDQTRVIGTLLGRVENGVAEITNSFAVPHLENGDEVAVGKDFHTQMYNLHQRVNEHEVIVGWYATTTDGAELLDEYSCLIHDFYGSVCEMPVHLVVDTSLKADQLQVSAFVSSPLDVVENALTNQFKQVPVTQKISEPEAIALSAMSKKDEDISAKSLPSELGALEEAMQRLYECVDGAASYVSDVVAGKVAADVKIGRELSDALATIPLIRQEQFDQIFSSGVQDLLMVSYLSGLTQAQLSMAEKLINTSATVFSRDEIGVEQLQSLKEKFADGDLNEKEFVSLFREIIDSSLSETQLTELFQKIDANSDGTVDWDELTNYMFLSGSDNSGDFIGDDSNSYYETAQPDKLGGEINLDASTNSHGTSGSGNGSGGGSSGGGGGENSVMRPLNHHKDIVTRVLRLEKPYTYLTASKDGSVRTWNANTMQFQTIVTTGKNWITDISVMRRSNRLAVASMNRTLGFYDLNSNALIGEITEYSKRQCIPLCLEYVEKPADDREALVIGDDTGGITVMTCSNQWMACDGRSTTGTTTTATTGSTGMNVTNPTNAAGSASLEAYGFSSRTKFKKHTDWVTRVKWVNDIRAIVATSLDTNISIIDIDRMVVKFEYNRHKKGVFDLVWCSSTRLIASCGMERDISIWNPYSSQRAVATLRGHTSSVLHLVSDDDNYQIISVASDNTFKVWDVRNHRCLQTWVDRYKSTGGCENRISALLYDPKFPCLISATTHLTRWPFKVQADEELEDNDKERPMAIASYNGVFHQVVTAEMSTDSVVKTWSAETGDEICCFANAHGQSPVTAVTFDYPGRRLLTGGHDGQLIKMWNFSNGALVKQFLKHEAESPASPSSTTTPPVTASGMMALLRSPSPSTPDVMAGIPTSDVSTPSTASPRKRKVRDIMLLPPTFGIDAEGRRGSSAMENAELPSPTKARLQRGQDEPVAVSRLIRESAALTPRRPSAITGDGSGTDEHAHHPRRPPPHLQNKYRQKEVTSILDIERNLRVGMGDFICQRFVCSVGWDRNIFVWADKNDESEALPVHILPNAKTLASNAAKCHTMDILALVYIPPAYIATAGLDGKILLWSLNSGEFVSKLHQSSGSIETMFYAQKIEMLFASGEHGQLICIDRSMATQAIIKLEHPHDAVVALRCDRTNTHLVTGDATGHVKVWDLTISPNHEGLMLDYCCHWRPAQARIVSVDFVEHVRVAELYVLLSCGNGDVGIWTLDGIQVGCFGRHRAWQLGRPSSYLAATSSCSWTDPLIEHPPPKQLIHCYSIAALNSTGNETRETFLLEDSMPKPGEVWICVSGHRTRAFNMNAAKKQQEQGGNNNGNGPHGSNGNGGGSNALAAVIVASGVFGRRTSSNTVEIERDLSSLSYVLQRVAETTTEVTDLITVSKVTRGEVRVQILCWDGNGHKAPVQKTIEMSEFVRKAGWSKHTLLSQFIGRMFLRHEQGCFRVNAVTMNPVDSAKPDKKVFALIDTNGNEHGLRPLNEAVSMARLKVRDAVLHFHQQQAATVTGARRLTSPRKRSTLSEVSDSASLPLPLPQLQAMRLSSNKLDVNSGSGSTSPNSPLSQPPGGATLTTLPTVGITGTTAVTGVTSRALPLLWPREKRQMGGVVPKRSSVRIRHDQSVDFRRIHNPDDIPKSFRQLIHHKAKPPAAGAHFDGLLPE